MHVRRRFVAALAGGALAVAVGPVAGAGPAAAAPAAGSVTLVHGLRGLLADVSVDGQVVLRGFAPNRVTDPLSLPAGAHAVVIRRSQTPASTPPVLSGNLTVAPGSVSTTAVGLDASSHPHIYVFPSDAAALGVNGAGVVIRDLAAAPGVQVSLDGTALPGALTPGASLSKTEPAGQHALLLRAGDGSGGPLVPAQDVPVVAGKVTVLYLTGSAADNSLGWLAMTVGLAPGQQAPTLVRTGDSGLVAPHHAEGAFPVLVLPMLAGLVLLIVWRRRTA